jgi:uncharacterized protein YecT (DUF1311 family)
MNSYIAVFLLLLPFLAFSDELDCENPMTTYEMNVCSNRDSEKANTILKDYLAKAIEKYSQEIEQSGEDNSGIQLLEKSQVAWLDYRKTYCSAIYEKWSGGTMRGVMHNSCMLDMTKRRTLEIWEDYLTYMDSVKPVLPKPE